MGYSNVSRDYGIAEYFFPMIMLARWSWTGERTRTDRDKEIYLRRGKTECGPTLFISIC